MTYTAVPSVINGSIFFHQTETMRLRVIACLIIATVILGLGGFTFFPSGEHITVLQRNNRDEHNEKINERFVCVAFLFQTQCIWMRWTRPTDPPPIQVSYQVSLKPC